MRKSVILFVCLCAPSMLLFGQNSSPRTLKEAYGGAFKVGCAVNSGIVSGRNAKALSILQDNFNAISPENDLKPEVIHPARDRWNFGPGDRYVQFGKEHGMFVLGHTLIWHNQTPSFFFTHDDGTPNSRDEMREVLRSYIETVIKHYDGKVDAWDVVNEIVGDDGNYRSTVWTNAFDGDGDEIVRLAFKYASEYSPGTELYYNDFNMWRPAKRDGVIRMIRMLQKEGIRIDGVGIQAHWGLNYPKNEYIEACIDSFATLGIKVMVTELDVDVLPISREGQVIGRSLNDPLYQLEEFEEYLDPYKNGLPPEVDRQLAERYSEIMGIFYRKRDKIDRVTFWGMDDGMSWKNGSPIPNRTNYPLLWNRGLDPKTAFKSVLDVPSLY
ncbi:MAG: endo-1,4-beta-xylanase [Bacteroidaceae bacterium]|nr:endo-1,4-beta-xylanase [Bacteroidaceae bacterium]